MVFTENELSEKGKIRTLKTQVMAVQRCSPMQLCYNYSRTLTPWFQPDN